MLLYSVDCEAVHYPEFSCKVDELVGMADVDLRKVCPVQGILAIKYPGDADFTNRLRSFWGPVIAG